jgi:hypothetical protein
MVISTLAVFAHSWQSLAGKREAEEDLVGWPWGVNASATIAALHGAHQSTRRYRPCRIASRWPLQPQA